MKITFNKIIVFSALCCIGVYIYGYNTKIPKKENTTEFCGKLSSSSDKNTKIEIQKSEFKDVIWNGYPLSYSESNRTPIWNIIHCTDGSENVGDAKSNSDYDKKRTDGASAHFYYDPSTSIQEVFTKDIAFSALLIGNKYGIQHELCGKASQSKQQWLDKNSKSIIENSAKNCAYICKKYDIPIKWLSYQEIKNKNKGFCTHADITACFEGTHTDPGIGFPKLYFLERVTFWYNKI